MLLGFILTFGLTIEVIKDIINGVKNMACPTALSTNDLKHKVIRRDIEWIIENTKTDYELENNFEQFKKDLSIKLYLYINENFDEKR